jgi:hypothetical protein
MTKKIEPQHAQHVNTKKKTRYGQPRPSVAPGWERGPQIIE